MKIERVWEVPNKYTFKMRCVSALLGVVMNGGTWADPFCGLYSPAQIRNDADEANQAEHHMDGLDFLKSLADKSVDGVLFDPPYSTEQALRKYKPKHNGTAGRSEYWARCKDEIARVVKPRGTVVCFGWDSTGIGKKRGFELQEVLLICHGACHNDTIITVEGRPDLVLPNFSRESRGEEMNPFAELVRQIFDDDLLETAYPKLVEQLTEAVMEATREHMQINPADLECKGNEGDCRADIARRARLILRAKA